MPKKVSLPYRDMCAQTHNSLIQMKTLSLSPTHTLRRMAPPGSKVIRKSSIQRQACDPTRRRLAITWSNLGGETVGLCL